MDQYFGTYHKFETTSKTQGALLLGADNLVGDRFTIEISSENGKMRAWVKNKFDKRIAYFNDEFSRKLSIVLARGWKAYALLSFVAYTDMPEPGSYWGEAAVICFDRSIEKPMETFVSCLGRTMAEGIRPDVELGDQGVEKVLSSNGEWTPEKRVPMPNMQKGSAVVKSRRSASEKLIEQGRAKNKGCYLVSILFLLLIVAVVLFGLKSCGIIPIP